LFLNLKPNDIEGLLHRGLAKEHLGDQIGAIADYTHLISVSPKDIRAFYNRGNAKNLLGQYHEAYEDFVKVIEISPNDADALINKAHLETVFGKYDIALQNCNKAINLGLDNEDAHFTRATIYEHLKLMKEALADLDRVLVINPVNSYALLYRGLYKLKLKDQSACADLKKALELGEQGALKPIKKNCK
jgi:tetratricopeptide (TPR) repeat protein